MTWLVALGSNLSALWILIANGWMQNPVGAKFNPDTMRMEVTDFADVLFNPVAQAKFVHTVSAGYVIGAMFVLAISAFYLLAGRHIELAKRSMTVAASFGLAAALSVVVLGDESGYTAGENQKMKIAAIEAMWDTEPAPASFTIVRLPDLANRRTDYEVKVPWMLGLIATRSIDKTLPGIKELVGRAEERIRSGLIAYDALEKVRAQPDNAARAGAGSRRNGADLGYALLLKKIGPTSPTPPQTRSLRPRGAPCRLSRRCSGASASWSGSASISSRLFAVAFCARQHATANGISRCSCGWRC